MSSPAQVKLVQQCCGIDGMWGLRAENADSRSPIGRKLADEIERAGGDVVAGDCHLANTAITEQTGRDPQHPLQVVARAYGIAPERRDRRALDLANSDPRRGPIARRRPSVTKFATKGLVKGTSRL